MVAEHIVASVRSEPDDEDDDDDDDNVQDHDHPTSQHNHHQQQQQNQDKSKGGSTAEHKNAPLKLGGVIDTPAYCLLDGVLDQQLDTAGGNTNGEGETAIGSSPTTLKRVTYPIRFLPCVLGREHHTESNHFLALGSDKSLSREHCRIDYRTAHGILKHSSAENKFVYKADDDDDDDEEGGVKPKELINPKNAEYDEKGYYVITCLGKNRIVVNGVRLEKNQSALLTSGSAIRISNYNLYFFLASHPSDAKTMQIPMPPPSATTSLADAVVTTTLTTGSKKRNMENNPIPMAVTSKRSRVAASSASATGTTLQAEIDAMPTLDLLEQISDAIANGKWDRRLQLIGSTVSCRAVLEAAQEPEVKRMARENGGISRSEMMAWIAESERFGDWVKQMLQKLEDKSYQASITKALIKANFTRTANSGRYIKWILPTGEGSEALKKKSNAASITSAPSAKSQQDDKSKGNIDDDSNSNKDDEDDDDGEESGAGNDDVTGQQSDVDDDDVVSDE